MITSNMNSSFADSDYVNFKHLLEYFVAHLEYVAAIPNNRGFNEYIEPLVNRGNFKRTGQGHLGHGINNQIENWNHYKKSFICINIQHHQRSGYQSGKTCYLNWNDTYDNIRANWSNNQIESLTIKNSNPKYNHADRRNESLKKLGLFDNNPPNDTLKSFLEDFYKLFCEDTKSTNKGEHSMPNDILSTNLAEQLKHSRNLILHGAPGTGKTYLAKQIAEKMGAETDFVQFHPSYDYTDFVEGLRPVQNEADRQIGFERKDGVFKEFCERALLAMNVSLVSDNFEQVWEKVVDYLNENNFMDIPLLTGKSTFRVELNENGDGLATRTYENDDYKKGEWIQGKSKFYNKEQLYNIYKGLPGIPSRGHDNYRKAVIEHWKKNFGLIDYSVKEKSENETVKPFIFIIDEINRGELSKIFGELFYAIDPGYRISFDDLKKHRSGEKKIHTIRTQYANLETSGNEFDKALRANDYGHFFVPENVYIIGTMNDIDRSVDSMDFAFRRRFAFKEITADVTQSMLDEKTDENGNKSGLPQEIADEAKNRMSALNDAISKNCGLPSSYHIGGAYFLKLKEFEGDTETKFKNLWEYHLSGLLREYLRGSENEKEKLASLKNAYFETEAENGFSEAEE